MKKLIIIIIILIIVFLGMLGYKNIVIKKNNNISMQEIENIETYITKIYMWKEITKEALPTFENINNADDIWIWEVVKKNLEDYELTYDQIEEKAKEIFGDDLEKTFPKQGNESITYNEENDKYYAEGRGLDEQEDEFILNKVEKTKDGYEVEIIEYIEDYSNLVNNYSQNNNSETEEQEIIIKNLKNEEIAKVKSSEEESSKEIVKNNAEKFTKKKLKLKQDKENSKLYIESSSDITS